MDKIIGMGNALVDALAIIEDDKYFDGDAASERKHDAD